MEWGLKRVPFVGRTCRPDLREAESLEPVTSLSVKFSLDQQGLLFISLNQSLLPPIQLGSG